jgi:hypothetical protein
MAKTSINTLARLAPALALFSCAPPKAVVIKEAPVPATRRSSGEKPALAASPAKPAPPDDGLRLPDMVTMPNDSELRATHPVKSATSTDTGAVIARPPVEQPPATQPKSGD